MDDLPRDIRYPFDTAPDPAVPVEVAEGVLWFRLPLPMALDHVNVYALDDGDGWTIVDTGLFTRKSRDIWEAMLNGPLGGRPLNRVVLTHHHPDHVGMAGWLRTAHGAELAATRVAWLTARMLTLDDQDRPTDETVAFWRSAGMDASVLETRLKERPFNFADVVAPIPLGYSRLDEGGRIEMGGRTWTVRLGQGHAPDHATFWSEDDPLVIGGDQLLSSISPNLGVYATEPEADPVAEWLESCHRFQSHALPDHFVLPGHKLPYRGLPTRLAQLIENHEGALKRLRRHLARPASAVECFPPLFKRAIGPGEYGLAMVEAVAHCVHLWQSGEAVRTRRVDGAWAYQMKDADHGPEDPDDG